MSLVTSEPKRNLAVARHSALRGPAVLGRRASKRPIDEINGKGGGECASTLAVPPSYSAAAGNVPLSSGFRILFLDYVGNARINGFRRDRIPLKSGNRPSEQASGEGLRGQVDRPTDPATACPTYPLFRHPTPPCTS